MESGIFTHRRLLNFKTPPLHVLGASLKLWSLLLVSLIEHLTLETLRTPEGLTALTSIWLVTLRQQYFSCFTCFSCCSSHLLSLKNTSERSLSLQIWNPRTFSFFDKTQRGIFSSKCFVACIAAHSGAPDVPEESESACFQAPQLNVCPLVAVSYKKPNKNREHAKLGERLSRWEHYALAKRGLSLLEELKDTWFIWCTSGKRLRCIRTMRKLAVRKFLWVCRTIAFRQLLVLETPWSHSCVPSGWKTRPRLCLPYG